MTADLVIVGAGGFGRETVDVVTAVNEAASQVPWRLVGVVDDEITPLNARRLQALGVAHLGTVDELVSAIARPRYVIGIGSPAVRRQVSSVLDEAGFEPAVLVHPHATIGSEVEIGGGTVICAGARVTTNIRLGRHVHLNPNVTVGHDTDIGDFVSMNPASSVSGDCIIESDALIGVGAVVLNRLRVGRGSLVGAGACVVRDVAEQVVVKGVPAR